MAHQYHGTSPGFTGDYQDLGDKLGTNLCCGVLGYSKRDQRATLTCFRAERELALFLAAGAEER